MATNADQLRAEANRLLAEAFDLVQQSRIASNQGNLPLSQQLLEQSRSLSDQANRLLQQAELSQNSVGTASSGQVIIEEGTGASSPVPPASVLAPTGRINRDNIETGTNAPVRSQEETQATPPKNDGNALPFVQTGTGLNILPEDLAALEEPYVVTQAGAAANRDDNTRPNSNSTAQIINASFNQRITPRPNVLDQYASYTYAVTWYLLTPDQYNEMVRTQKKNCATWQLLMQSGGAPTEVAGATANSTATAGRNKFFDKDYYLDDLEIDSLVPLKGTGAANTATNIRFKVTEPHGITLIDNLSRAIKTLYQEKNVDKNANYLMAQHCLVVRFYGYNENGELVNPGRRGTNGQTNITDPRAIVEKFYPFVVTNIKFRIPKDRVVEYDVEGKPIPHFYNKSQDRGTIPFAFELTGETVEQILQGKPVGTTYPDSPGERRDSPQPNTSAPTSPSAIDPNQAGSAQVDENGNFTGSSNSPFQVGA